MHRPLLLILSLVLISVPVFGQSALTDSQTLQALLSEVRQLRQDLRTITIASQRAQVLLYRLQAQVSVVRRMQERVDDTRSKLTGFGFRHSTLSGPNNNAAAMTNSQKVRGTGHTGREYRPPLILQVRASPFFKMLVNIEAPQ